MNLNRLVISENRQISHLNQRQARKSINEGTYQHVISRPVCPIVLLDELLPLLLVVLVLPHVGVDLRIANVEHEEDADEH